MATDFQKGGQYEIVKILYVSTKVHEKSVILQIRDDEGKTRSFFAPDKYADCFRNNYKDPEEINCFQLYLQFDGFSDEAKKINPLFQIIYKGEAQQL